MATAPPLPRSARAPKLLLMGLIALGAGCGDGGGDEPAQSGGRGTLAITVGALGEGGDAFSAIGSATYDLLVETYDDARGWVEVVRIDGYDSTDPNGALTYIAPCEAGEGGRQGQVTITLRRLFDPSGVELTDAVLPVTASQQFTCLESRDVPAFFELTVLRSADTGFTDVVVDIEHVVCAAKFDCQPGLLMDEAGAPQPTLVTGLSCRGAGADNAVIFTSGWRCFDADGVPIAASPYAEVFTGFEGEAGQAFHNTATRLDRGFMAPFSRCEYRARGLVISRDGGPRDAQLRLGGGHIAWDLDIRMDASGALVCEGEVAPGYTDLRADHAASPRDGSLRPSREAPLEQDTYLLQRAVRRVPDCVPEEQAAAQSRLAMVALEGERDTIIEELERLEVLAADRREAAGLANIVASHLASARAAASQDPVGQALYDALAQAVEAVNALDAHTRAASWADEGATRSAVRVASDAIWVLITDAEGGVFDVTHHEAAQAAAADLVAGLGALVSALESTIAQAQLALTDTLTALDGAIAAHPAALASMNACVAGQRELDGLRYEHLVARFPWAQGELDDPIVDAGFVAIDGDVAAGPRALELVSACAFGDADHIERIAAQVRVLAATGGELARGWIDLVRTPAAAGGFVCVAGADGGCALLPLAEIPCAVGGAAVMDERGGYIVIDAP